MRAGRVNAGANARISRRAFVRACSVAAGAVVVSACGSATRRTGEPTNARVTDGRWLMPAEDGPHDATWMCWPSDESIWGADLGDVQRAVARIAIAIGRFEPVRLLVRPGERDRAATAVDGIDAELIEAPVDDLWARDTLPSFLVAADAAADPLAAGRVRFNGWGGKQVHDGDELLARVVADHLEIPFVDAGLVGEGGGIENDGHGTLLAARSSWVNANRNPGVTEREIADRLCDLLGAERLIWVDGLAGADITDGHIDTLARFAGPDRIVLGAPSYREPGEEWYDLAVDTEATLRAARTIAGDHYTFTTLVEPSSPRGLRDAFLSSYVNYYVCNGAVIAPSFGDEAADDEAGARLADLYPGREIVQLDIDPIAAGGGGIHCATQQQPTVPAAG